MTTSAFPAKHIVTAPEFNAKIQAPVVVGEMGAMPLCLLTHSLDQTAPNATGQVLTFDTETEDAGGMHNPAVNPSRITIAVPGLYQLWSLVAFDTNATGIRVVYFTKAGAGEYGNTRQTPVASDRTAGVALATLRLVAGDWVDCRVYHTAGVSLTIPSYSGVFPVFGARWVNP